jgi:N6-adenosine-specific RNA methylase IME4
MKPIANTAGGVRDKVAAIGGKSGYTLEKAEAVVDAAEAEPERFGKLKEQMDRTGRVDGAFKRLRNMRQGDALKKEPPAMPGRGPYRVFVFDMPWAAEPDGEPPAETGRGYFDYETMTTAQMVEWVKRNKVTALYHPDGVWAWFWVTNFHLVHNHHLPVLEALGLEPVHIRTWAKDKMGRGQVLRGQTEHVLLCKAGKPPAIVLTNQSTLLPGKVRKDSQKPDQFYVDVEALTPASRYVEFFARRKMPANWDGYGDQVGTLPEPAPASPHAFEAKVEPHEALRPPMIDVLVAKAAAGEIAFAPERDGWFCSIAWFDGARFEQVANLAEARKRKSFRGELTLERQGSTIIVAALTDETGLTHVHSCVPSGKLRKFLAAWKPAATVMLAAKPPAKKEAA